jgi:8-hydroxy-5-deazaflavin:NADPH oxidoreductase
VTIAIVGGTGPAGSGLARRWAEAGETIVIGSRDRERAAQKAAEIADRLGGGGACRAAPQISGKENSEACRAAEIVVLTIPFESQAEMLKQLTPVLSPGQILVDATVPLAASIGGRPTRTLGVWQGSAAEQAAELVGGAVAVVAAFHNLAAQLLHQDGPVDCDVIVSSNQPEASKRVRSLARKIPGVRAIDGGKLENARIIEQITALLIGLNIRHKGHSGIRITGLPPAAYDI